MLQDEHLGHLPLKITFSRTVLDNMGVLALRPIAHESKVGDMNHDQGIFIPQGPITRTRAKKLQQTLYTYIQAIQAMISSSNKILEDVGDLPYMLCKVELQERDALKHLMNSVEFMKLVQGLNTFHLLHYLIII